MRLGFLPLLNVLISVAIPTRVDGPRALTLTSRTLCLFFFAMQCQLSTVEA